MARNPERRVQLADAALRVLARQGSRGLTHRAVDTEAEVPRGTASNYFSSRDDIIDAILARIGERLAPDPAVHAELARRPPGRDLFATYLKDIVHRLTADRDATLALFELRLDAARRPSVAEVLGGWLRGGLDADVAFTEDAGLPGSRWDIVLFHYALDGLILDQLTVPIDEQVAADDAVEVLVERLLAAREPTAGGGLG
ncbi:TetR/AcrR family transcriptional regulator [Micropruina sp.]|uniref:TetR/AcrR family transcriptional regulator n=1 Tax=Micropruina sp. TaxID=2737536 RepID=UPI0039E66A2E